MTHPQAPAERRAPRLRPAEITPVVLRVQNGRRVAGELQCVSLTGGLLASSELLPQGSVVKVMFVTPMGPVLGTAEMLAPVSLRQQAFRFSGIEDAGQRRLSAAIHSSPEAEVGGKEQVPRQNQAESKRASAPSSSIFCGGPSHSPSFRHIRPIPNRSPDITS
jgi:hypothetical protein